MTRDISGSRIKADFAVKPAKGKATLKVRFTDKSHGICVGQVWEFGDGESSVERSPVHISDKPGRYTVTLIKTGIVASDEVTRKRFVRVT